MISGYIMWTTTERRDRGPLAFWLARIVRIVPLYWIFTATYVAAALITPESFFSREARSGAHREVVPVRAGGRIRTLGLVAPVYTLGWTLNYEMFFYLLFGLCLFVREAARCGSRCSRRSSWHLIASGLILQPRSPVLRTYVDPIMLEFLAGVVLAIVSPHLMRCGTLLGLALLAAAALWVAVVYGYGLRFWSASCRTVSPPSSRSRVR